MKDTIFYLLSLCSYRFSADGKANFSSKMPFFIAMNAFVLFFTVVISIVVLVKCRRGNQKSKLSTSNPINISLRVVENSQGPSRMIEVNFCCCNLPQCVVYNVVIKYYIRSYNLRHMIRIAFSLPPQV